MDEEDHTFAFMVEDAPVSGVKEKASWLPREPRSTSSQTLQNSSTLMQISSHRAELADEVRTSSISVKKGTAKVHLRDTEGRMVDMMLMLMLMEALYIPSFSQPRQQLPKERHLLRRSQQTHSQKWYDI